MTPINPEQIEAALASSDWTEAERLCEAALASSPDNPALLVSMARALSGQQRLSVAAEILEQLAIRHPNDALHLKNYVVILLQVGDLDKAEHALEKLASLELENSEALVELGLLRMRRQNYVAARDTLIAALAIDRESPVARIHASRACTYCRDYEDAEVLLQPWCEWLPLNDELQLELGSLLLAQSKGEAAWTVIGEVARRSPANIQATLYLGVACERLNKILEAQFCLEQLSGLANQLTDEQRGELFGLKAKLALRGGDLAEARNSLELAGPSSANDFAYYFLLASIYDKQKERVLAMQTLQTAHDLQMADLASVLPEGSSLDDGISFKIKNFLGGEDFRRWPTTSAPDGEQSPIFIVGFPRSGTTLLEQMLDAHPDLQSMDEKPFVSQLAELLQRHGLDLPLDLWRLKQEDCDELRKQYWANVCAAIPRNWNTRLIDKNPFNMLLLPLIYRLFPEAKFIFALRHPFDVILSCYMQNFRASGLAAACANLEKLAKTYVFAMESMLHHAELLKPDSMSLHYEKLVEDLPREVQRLAEFIGLADQSPLINFDQHARNKGYIGTPSYTQVIQPINRSGIDRWRPYSKEFEPLIPILQPIMTRLGYSPV